MPYLIFSPKMNYMKRSLILTFVVCVFFSLASVAQMNNGNIEKCLSGVVTVAVYKTMDVGKAIIGFRGGGNVSDEAYRQSLILSGAKGSGSGFIINRNGKFYVITNAHVVESASEESGSIFVYTINQSKYEAKVIGGDSFYDLAILELQKVPGSEAAALSFSGNEPRIADKVFAIGNPLGEYPYTVTDGIISAKNRTREGLTGKFGFLQHTATIIWGNSGGPLINENGEVVGVNTKIAFATGPDGKQILQSQLNFSIEASVVKRVVDDVFQYGKLRRAFLGIEVSQSFSYVQKDNSYDLYKIDEAPVITGFMEGSPASRVVRNKVGMRVLKVNDMAVRNMEEVYGEFEKTIPGATVKLLVEKNGATETLEIPSRELKTSDLADLAQSFIAENTQVELDKGRAQVYLIAAPKNSYQYGNNGFAKPTAQQASQPKSGYYVIAGGIYQQNDPGNMFRITALADMGVALRLCSLTGIFDYYLLPGNQQGKAQLLRQYLSGKDNIVKSTLWY